MAIPPQLIEERDALVFKRRLLGVVTLLETLAHDVDAADDLSSDELMWVHFDQSAAELRRLMPILQHRPDIAPLIPHAQSVCESLDRLHETRQRVLSGYRTLDGTDIVRHPRERDDENVLLRSERAVLMGMSLPQLDAWEAQLDPHGYYKLSQTEKQQFVQAIRRELGQ